MPAEIPISRNRRLQQWIMYVAGGLLVLSGAGHVLAWLVLGGSLEGSLSLRKPILFGLSAGATVLSLGWLAGKLRPRRGDLLLLASFSVAMLVEVGLITSQQWRGVPSHFNRATPYDATVLAWIEILVVFVTGVIADLTWRSLRPLEATNDMALAVRAGMLLLLASCLLGFVLVAYGNQQLARGLPPERFGAAGVMKFPHGVPMHAIQFLPILAWLLRICRVPERQRQRSVACAAAALTTFTLFSLLQTFSGRARFQWWWLSAIVLFVAAALMMAAAWIAAAHLLRSRRAMRRTTPT